jgi:hypothetical protein
MPDAGKNCRLRAPFCKAKCLLFAGRSIFSQVNHPFEANPFLRAITEAVDLTLEIDLLNDELTFMHNNLKMTEKLNTDDLWSGGKQMKDVGLRSSIHVEVRHVCRNDDTGSQIDWNNIDATSTYAIDTAEQSVQTLAYVVPSAGTSGRLLAFPSGTMQFLVRCFTRIMEFVGKATSTFLRLLEMGLVATPPGAVRSVSMIDLPPGMFEFFQAQINGRPVDKNIDGTPVTFYPSGLIELQQHRKRHLIADVENDSLVLIPLNNDDDLMDHDTIKRLKDDIALRVRAGGRWGEL